MLLLCEVRTLLKMRSEFISTGNEEALTVLWKTQYEYNFICNGSVLKFKQKYSSATQVCLQMLY